MKANGSELVGGGERGNPQECAAREILRRRALEQSQFWKGLLPFRSLPRFGLSTLRSLAQIWGRTDRGNEGTWVGALWSSPLKTNLGRDHTFVEWLLEDKPFFSAMFTWVATAC